MNSNVVKRTTVERGGKHYVVSTVRLDPMLRGLDSMLSLFPLLEDRADLSKEGEYETMVFPATEEGEVISYTEVGFDRYSTQEEAEVGHDALVETWQP